MGPPPAAAPPGPPAGPFRWHWHLDIDRHLNPVLPPSALPRLPHPVAHFLGYRSHPSTTGPLGNLLVVFWAALGIFCSLSIIGAVGQQIPAFVSKGTPIIVGSFGAAAVLDFYAIESPLAQPRNAIFGQLLSTLTGVAICKLFALSPNFESVRWLGAALACALATAIMGLTNTVHPPAGATALMAVLDPDLSKLGWFLVAPVLLGGALMLSVALLINNIQRRFPYYWWSPEEMGGYWKARRRAHEHEKPSAKPERSPSNTDDGGSTIVRDAEASGDTEEGQSTTVEFVSDHQDTLVVSKNHVRIPRNMYLTFEEKLVLETLSQRL